MEYTILLLLFFYSLNLLIQIECKLYPIAVRLPLKGNPPPAGAALWPRPFNQDFTKKHFFLNKNEFKFILSEGKINNCEREILNPILSHYRKVLFPPKIKYQFPSGDDAVLNSLSIEVVCTVPNPSNCASYYPIIETTDQEHCSLNLLN